MTSSNIFDSLKVQLNYKSNSLWYNNDVCVIDFSKLSLIPRYQEEHPEKINLIPNYF